MKLDHSEYSDYCLHLYCYNRNVLIDKSFGFLKVFHVELENPRCFHKDGFDIKQPTNVDMKPKKSKLTS